MGKKGLHHFGGGDVVVLAGTGPKWWGQFPKREVTWPKGFLPNSKSAHFVKSKQNPAPDRPRAGKPTSTVSPRLQSRPRLTEPCPPTPPAEPGHPPSPPPRQTLLPGPIPDRKPVDAPQKATIKNTPSPNTGACNLKPKHHPSLATSPPCEM